MAINRFSLYQMEQFKKERNKKLMESATKAVEECGFSSGEIKKMMKKKKNKKEDKEMEECGCGPMKKGKKLSKNEKAPGMRPEPKDKAVVHNMESDIVESKKSVGDIDKQKERIWKRTYGKKPKESSNFVELWRKANRSKEARGLLNRIKSKKIDADPSKVKSLGAKKTKESDTPVKATKVVISESRKNREQIMGQYERVKDRLTARAEKQNPGASSNASFAKYKAQRLAINSLENRDLARPYGGEKPRARGARNEKGKVIKGQKNYKAKESDTPLKATKVVINESRKTKQDIEYQARRLQNKVMSSGKDKSKKDKAYNKINAAKFSSMAQRSSTKNPWTPEKSRRGVKGVKGQNKYIKAKTKTDELGKINK